MALKFKIGPSAYEALGADVKKEYKASGAEYVLDLEDYEDPAELRRARDHEKTAAADAKREAAAEKKRADKAAEDLATAQKSVPDVAKAVKDAEDVWQKKYDTDIAAVTGKSEKAIAAIRTREINKTALDIASKISTAPKLLARDIAERIQVDLDDELNATVKFKDPTGKAAALSAADIEKEFSTNPEYKAIMLGSRASGGGGAPRLPTGGGAPAGQQGNPSFQSGEKPVDLSRMDPAQLAAHIRAGKEAAGSA